jgi:hypothetical protein
MTRVKRVNPHAVSGDGSDMHPWLYDSLDAIDAGLAWDHQTDPHPNRRGPVAYTGWHGLTAEAAEKSRRIKRDIELEQFEANNAEQRRRFRQS